MKKLIASLLLCFVIFSGIFSMESFAADLTGDLTGDGKITLRDAMLLYDFCNGVYTFTDEQLSAADVSGDGRINRYDADLIYDRCNLFDKLPGDAGNKEEAVLEPIYNEQSWRFEIDLTNNGKTALTLTKVEIRHLNDGVLFGDVFAWCGKELANIFLGDLVLEPGQSRPWVDNHPMVSDFNEAEYRFVFIDSEGNFTEKVLLYKLGLTPPEADSDGFFTPIYNRDSWSFQIFIENSGETDITLTKLETRHFNDGVLCGDVFVTSGNELAEIGLGNLVIKPGKTKIWTDNHPMVSDFNQIEYRFFFTSADGGTVEKAFKYKLEVRFPELPDYSGNYSKDLHTLRHDAEFEVEVFDGVYWVPASALGESRYTNSEIYKSLSSSPEEKQTNISTLYEALQLYQIGGFYASDDNIRIREGNIDWEHHKPGYHAVRTNNGCCATDSNWLRYILDGDYDEVGYIATSQRDGSGHIYNYIKQDGFYYFIDLTHYRTDWIATAVESGNLDDYYASDFILGNIHKSATVEAFVDYVQSGYSDPPGLMFKYTAENCLAIDGVWGSNGITITYENTVPVEIIFDDPNDNLYIAFVDPPKNYPDWSINPSYKFP